MRESFLSYEWEQGSVPLEGSYQNATIREMEVLQIDFDKIRNICTNGLIKGSQKTESVIKLNLCADRISETLIKMDTWIVKIEEDSIDQTVLVRAGEIIKGRRSCGIPHRNGVRAWRGRFKRNVLPENLCGKRTAFR